MIIPEKADLTSINSIDTDQYADRIRVEYQAFEGASRKALQHARHAGEMLVVVKQQVPHGSFSNWLAIHFPGSNRTAQRFMQIANNWSTIEANTPRVADMSLRKAEQIIAQPRRTDHIQDLLSVSADQLGWQFKHWDLFAQLVVLLDTADQTPREISDRLGVDLNKVEPILCPRYPDRSGCYSPRDAAKMHRHDNSYMSTIKGMVHGSLGLVYDSAARNADRWSMGKHKPSLLAMAKHHGRQSELAYEKGFGHCCDGLRGAADFALYFASITADARHALGVEPLPDELVKAPVFIVMACVGAGVESADMEGGAA